MNLNLNVGRRFCSYNMSDEEFEAAKIRVIFAMYPPKKDSILKLANFVFAIILMLGVKR